MGTILVSQKVMATFKENMVQKSRSPFLFQGITCTSSSYPPYLGLQYSLLPGIVLVSTADPASKVISPSAWLNRPTDVVYNTGQGAQG